MSRHGSTARLAAVLVAGLFAVVLFSGVAMADGPAEVDLNNLGSGTDTDPYVITNSSELQAMNQSVDSYYELGGTINATNTSGWNGGKGFSPVGNESHPFNGSFDGNGYEIENLTVDRGDENYVGLFGYADGNAEIGNVTLRNATVTGNTHIGAFVGETNGEVYDVHVNGTVTTAFNNNNAANTDGGARTGGVVGMVESAGVVTNATADANVTGINADFATRLGGLAGYSLGEIRDSIATGDVQGSIGIGGLIGRNVGYIENATATGNVTGLDNNPNSVGGLAGFNGLDTTGTGTITRSHATGAVGGTNGVQVGGLVGANTFIVNESYATGTVTGTDEVGGLVGHNQEKGDEGTVSDSYANGTVIGGATGPAGGLVGLNDGLIERSYAVVDVPVGEGGLVGTNNDRVTGSYWDTDESGVTTTDGGVGLSTADMQNINATVEMYGLGFYDAWMPREDDYPEFASQSEYANGSEAYDGLVAGDGDENSPYQITTIYELQAMNATLDSTFELQTDLNASDTSTWYGGDGFKPVGYHTGGSGDAFDGDRFNGSFDGAGFAIQNLTINRSTESYVGLFGEATARTEIGNVDLRNVIVNGSAHIGALVGESNGTISDVHISGELTVRKDGSVPNEDTGYVGYDEDLSDGVRAGSLVGMLRENGTITNATSTANMTGLSGGDPRIGGLVGFSFGQIADSTASGTVNSTGGSGLGGLIGRNNGLIENVSATGNVTGDGVSGVGGVAGFHDGEIHGSFATGAVTGNGLVGGLVGSASEGSINRSYATGNVDGSSNHIGGLVGKLGNKVTRSHANGSVNGGDNVGGLVGYNEGGTVTESYAAGAVTDNTDVGGLVGLNGAGGTIRDSYATGSVDGTTNVGGLVGDNRATIERSYAVVDVPDGEDGFVANNGGTVTAGYWDTDASGVTDSDGGDGLSTFEMTALVAKDYMDLGFDATWNATDRYPRLAWEGVDEPDAYPTATPGDLEVWLLNDSDNGYYHNFSITSSGDVQWLGEVVASPGSGDSARLIGIAVGNATADYDTLVVGPGAYNLTNHQVNLTADSGANLTRVFSLNGSDHTEILRDSTADFAAFEEASFRVDNPAASGLIIGENGTFAANGDDGFYIDSAAGGPADAPLIGVYDAAEQFNLTVTNTDFGLSGDTGDTILFDDSNTAFTVDLDVRSHSGAILNASAASTLTIHDSTITEADDPRGNTLGGEGISFLTVDAGSATGVTVDNVTIVGATEDTEVEGVVDIIDLDTSASVTLTDLQINGTAQHAINVSTAFDTLSVSKLNLTDIGKRGVTITDTVDSVSIDDSEIHDTAEASLFANADISQYNVTGSTITDSSGRGIYLRGDIGNATVENNTLSDSVLTPIEFEVNTGQSTPYEIVDNHVDGSGDTNSLVVIRSNARVNITDNTLLNSSLRGVYTNATDSVIENNRIENSSGSKGIHLDENAHDALVVDTTVIDSATLGIHVDGANNATIRNTTVDTTGGYGIQFNNGAADGELIESTVRNTTNDALQIVSEMVSVTDLTLASGSIWADVTDAALNTSSTVPTGPGDYQAGGESVNVTFGGSNDAELDNVSLSYNTSEFAIDQRALDLWRYNTTGWHREHSTVDTDRQVVTTNAMINDSTVLSTFASNVSITAADTTVTQGNAGTLAVTATNASGALLETVVINVTDDGGLGGLTTGDTATTDGNGVARFGFQENSPGRYTVNVSWTNDTAVTDTATVRVRRTGGGGGGGGGQPPAPPETTVTVGDATEDDPGDGGESDTDDGSDTSRADTRVSVANPEPGQTLVIEGDDAYVTNGDPEPADDGSESDSSDDDSTDTGGASGGEDSDESSNVRSDRLSVTINTDRDFELSVTTYETDLTRSASGQNAQASIRPFASGIALLQPVDTVPQVSAPETVRAAAASFEDETATVSAGYVDIDTTLAPEEIDGATFEFSIRQAYLDELGVDAAAVRLYHRIDGEWVTRETTLLGTDRTYARFEGTMPEFSVFALGTGAPPIGVTEASLSASTVETGETATVSATVENRGQAAAEGTIELTVDGEVVDSETVSLAAGETGEISFAYGPTADGEHAIAVGGVDAGTLTVGDAAAVSRPPWWLLIVLLVAIVLIGVLWRRRDD